MTNIFLYFPIKTTDYIISLFLGSRILLVNEEENKFISVTTI